MTGTTTRSHGEQGVAVIFTALCLIPLMTFAAFGVDLASWYSRTSYLQKSADAAALAGTVWMPNLGKATTVACDSLLENGIDGGECGSGPFDVVIDRGATATSLLVTVTDPNAARYFSQVLSGGDQALTRSAEAEYNLPIPLGSPLNYFGGDSTRTVQQPPPDTYAIAWPTDYTTPSARERELQRGYGDRPGARPVDRQHRDPARLHIQRDRVQREHTMRVAGHRHQRHRHRVRAAA